MLNSDDLINKVKGYNKFLNPDRLNKAYDFAVKAHSNQKRASGDPYSVHPIPSQAKGACRADLMPFLRTY